MSLLNDNKLSLGQDLSMSYATKQFNTFGYWVIKIKMEYILIFYNILFC